MLPVVCQLTLLRSRKGQALPGAHVYAAIGVLVLVRISGRSVLTAIAVVVAGRVKAVFSTASTSSSRRAAQPVRDPAAERGVAEIFVKPTTHPPSPVSTCSARPLRLPVLFGRRRSHLRSYHPAPRAARPPGRTVAAVHCAICARPTGRRSRRMFPRQFPFADSAPAAPQRPAVPAELFYDSWLDYLYWDTELDP